MSSLYPDMMFSWDIRSMDELFSNGATRATDISREAILSSIRDDQDLAALKDEANKNLLNDKKFCKECITACVVDTERMDLIEELIDFLIGASEVTRRHVDSCIKEALTKAVKLENEPLVIQMLDNFSNSKKIKTLTDANELVEHAVYAAAVEEDSAILCNILKWSQGNKAKKKSTALRGKGPIGGLGAAAAVAQSGGSKLNSPAMLYSAKKNDYERVKILYR